MHGHIERLHHGVAQQRGALHRKILKISRIVLVAVAGASMAGSLVPHLEATGQGLTPGQAAHAATGVMWIGGFTALGVAVIAVLAMLLNAAGCIDLIHARRYVNTVEYLHHELRALHAETNPDTTGAQAQTRTPRSRGPRAPSKRQPKSRP